MPITSFTGEFRYLSNFYRAPVKVNGLVYPTVEHAYQAHKTLNIVARERIRSLPTPGAAKRAGQSVDLRADWESVKLDVMMLFVTAKFRQNLDLAAKLLATGNTELVEGNNWGDKFWGVCDGEGENHLGKILMQVREHLRQQS